MHPVYVRRRLRRRRALQAAKHFPLWLAGLIVVGGFGLMSIGVALGVWFTLYNRYTDDFVDPASMMQANFQGPSQIFDRNGQLLYELIDPQGTLSDPVPLDRISPLLQQATIAVEDASFYDNPGVNPRGLARAAYENFIDRDDGVLQGSGGSSITQQLVRNVYIDFEERAERSLDRKLREAFLAIELTRRYSKDQILEWYLNQISYGGIYNGAEAAAQGYFGKPATDLTLAEAALLAGIPASPREYYPIDEADGGFQVSIPAKQRQLLVLERMVQEGYITQEEADDAAEQEIVFVRQEFPIEAGHFVNYTRDRLLEMCEAGMIQKNRETQTCHELIFRGGLSVKTTLDLNLHKRAEEILQLGFLEPFGGVTMEEACQCHNGSIVSIDPNTGEILVYVGSRDFFNPQIDGEVDNNIAIKQPGSSFKPVVYLANFLHLRRHPLTVMWDEQITYRNPYGEDFVPINPDGRTRGAMPIRIALGSSQNIPANRAAEDVGVENVLETAHRVGVTTMVEDAGNYGPSIATGGSNIMPLDMAYVNAVIANLGEMVGVRTADLDRHPSVRQIDPVVVLEIRDHNGQIIYQHEEVREQVIPAPIMWQLTHTLTDCTTRYLIWGCGSVLDIPGQVTGAKTGTQQGPTSSSTTLATWTNGFSRYIATSIWIGNADNTLMAPTLASPIIAQNIYHAWMAAFHEGKPTAEFLPPEGAQLVTVPTMNVGGGCTGGQTWIMPGETYVETCAEMQARRTKRGGIVPPASGSTTIPRPVPVSPSPQPQADDDDEQEDTAPQPAPEQSEDPPEAEQPPPEDGGGDDDGASPGGDSDEGGGAAADNPCPEGFTAAVRQNGSIICLAPDG